MTVPREWKQKGLTQGGFSLLHIQFIQWFSVVRDSDSASNTQHICKPKAMTLRLLGGCKPFKV